MGPQKASSTVRLDCRTTFRDLIPTLLFSEDAMPLLPYRPHTLLRSGHLQTILGGTTCGWRPPHNVLSIQIELADGEHILAHEEIGVAIPSDAPVTILLHGLGGDHTSPYLQRLAHRLSTAGQNVWRVDMRGCGAGLTLAWRPPHAGRSDDLAAVVRAAHKKFPNSPINIAGFSLGGNIVLKMLGEAALGLLELPLDSIRLALAVAPPIELGKCADRMDTATGRIYTKYYLKNLGRQVAARRAAWKQWADIPADPVPRTIRQFDARYTVPLGGLLSTDQYYESCSAKPLIPQIATQTIVLVDKTDPVVTASSFMDGEVDNPNVEFQFTKHGGHMGYWGRDDSGKTIRWMEMFVQHHFSI